MRKSFILLLFLLMSSAAIQQDEVAPVVIALQDIPRGFQITDAHIGGDSAMIGIVFYPAEYVPAGALQRLDNVVGKWVRTDIPREQPVSEFYLSPDIRENPLAELPYPVSPAGYRVVRDRNTFVEVSYDKLENLRYPAGLAAGDEVMVITSTGVNDILRDETWNYLERVMITSLTEEEIVFSVTQEEATRLNEYLSTGFPITLAIYPVIDAGRVPFDEIINLTYLTTRPVNPLLLPQGTDMSKLRRIDE